MNAAKLRAVFGIYLQDTLAYRASGIIWVFTDAVQTLVLPLVMVSAARAGAIAGFDGGDFVLYYLCSMLLGGFITCYFMFDVASEIKEGQFSAQIIRPLSHFQLSFMRNLSWRMMRLCLTVPFFLFFLWLYRGMLAGATPTLGPELVVSIILGHLVAFTTSMAVAMTALYFGDAMGIFELYFFPQLFLSGQIFPIALLPDWAQGISRVLPFYYTLGLPTEIMVGKIPAERVWPLIGTQVLWAIGGYIAWKLLFRNGLKHYTGVGL